MVHFYVSASAKLASIDPRPKKLLLLADIVSGPCQPSLQHSNEHVPKDTVTRSSTTLNGQGRHADAHPKAWVHAEEAGKQQACKNAQQHIAPLVPAQPFPAASLEHKAAPYAQGQERPGGAPAE
eukprot:1160389-Pelagomonas_calceolata.AAC.6